MSMDKTSKDVSTQQVDPSVAKDSSALNNLFRGIASQGFQPDRGVTIADFTPQQKASFEGSDLAAAAFGMPTAAPTGGPTAEASASGIMGFRPSVGFDASKAALPPEYLSAMEDFQTGIGRERKYKQFKPKSGGGGKK